jgi:hypothetical protein
MMRATIRLIWMAFQVWLTAGRRCPRPRAARRAAGPALPAGDHLVSSSSTAASSGRASEGRTSSVTVRSRSRWRISVGPAVSLHLGQRRDRHDLPEGVTTG